jgi:hypothetical protein
MGVKLIAYNQNSEVQNKYCADILNIMQKMEQNFDKKNSHDVGEAIVTKAPIE